MQVHTNAFLRWSDDGRWWTMSPVITFPYGDKTVAVWIASGEDSVTPLRPWPQVVREERAEGTQVHKWFVWMGWALCIQYPK
jgi:hypothetical protein